MVSSTVSLLLPGSETWNKAQLTLALPVGVGLVELKVPEAQSLLYLLWLASPPNAS